MGVDSGRRLVDHFQRLLGVSSPGHLRRVWLIDQITPYPLWVGHAGNGSDARVLHDLGIEALVQVAAEEPPFSPPRSLIYHRFPLLDGPGNPPDVLRMAVETVASLIRLQIPTLVCCGMGLSRSPAITAAALAFMLGDSADETLRRLAKCHDVDISPGFWAEVREIRGSSSIEAP